MSCQPLLSKPVIAKIVGLRIKAGIIRHLEGREILLRKNDGARPVEVNE